MPCAHLWRGEDIRNWILILRCVAFDFRIVNKSDIRAEQNCVLQQEPEGKAKLSQSSSLIWNVKARMFSFR